MFADPISLTHNSKSHQLPRVYEEKDGTRYQTANQDLVLEIKHSFVQKRARRRSVIRLTHSKIAADPFVQNANKPVAASVYLVIDSPNLGFTADEKVQLISALADFLKADTNAASKKLVGGEA